MHDGVETPDEARIVGSAALSRISRDARQRHRVHENTNNGQTGSRNRFGWTPAEIGTTGSDDSGANGALSRQHTCRSPAMPPGSYMLPRR